MITNEQIYEVLNQQPYPKDRISFQYLRGLEQILDISMNDPEGRQQIEQILEVGIHYTKDPSYEAYSLVRRYKLDVEWAKRVVSKDHKGNRSSQAFSLLTHYTKNVDVQWVKHIIENDNTGDPAQFAYMLFTSRFDATQEWVENIITNAKTGRPGYYAYLMVLKHGSSRVWAEHVIENSPLGYPAFYANYMVKDCGSSPEWAKHVADKNTYRT